MELEVSLVKAFNWSLRDIDETSVESLIPFIAALTGRVDGSGQRDTPSRRVYCDQIDL